MPDIEVYLPQNKVTNAQEKLVGKFPQLLLWKTDFLTTRITPPWHGALPDGNIGWTNHAVVQFVVVSDHPRPLQRNAGQRHTTVATAWEAAFEEALREYEASNDKPDPVETIFQLVVAKHRMEMDSLASIQHDAVSDASRPTSVKDVLPSKMFN